MPTQIAVIGGGAAGIFAAVTTAEHNHSAAVTVFEATGEPLDKVRISGGGRCNVTHHCFDPAILIGNYPRGGRELRGPFSHFQPRDTIEWFASRGVTLKAESDGRMFPNNDSSATIINCLLDSARSAGVSIKLNARVKHVGLDDSGSFVLNTHDSGQHRFDRVLIATGNSPIGHRFAETLGHTIVPAVPSLFTFKVNDPRLSGLSGVSFDQVETTLYAGEAAMKQTGPMLITHWGLSGPAILKLSAWGARALHDIRYKASLEINFLPNRTPDDVSAAISAERTEHGKRQVHAHPLFNLPRRYWEQLTAHAEIDNSTTWSTLSKTQTTSLISELAAARFEIRGKGVFKEEFVTCGGVSLREIDFRTMQSRIRPGLFFAGEILDIDGVTGGFNFQSAWTTGFLAGLAMAADPHEFP